MIAYPGRLRSEDEYQALYDFAQVVPRLDKDLVNYFPVIAVSRGSNPMLYTYYRMVGDSEGHSDMHDAIERCLTYSNFRSDMFGVCQVFGGDWDICWNINHDLPPGYPYKTTREIAVWKPESVDDPSYGTW